MKVFLSWSGDISRRVATGLRDWLPEVLQAVEPWLSSEDLPYGTRWVEQLSRALDESKASIVCVTRQNLDSAWLQFEAGALARSDKIICPYLFDARLSELRGPLSHFQSAEADRAGTYGLMVALNQLAIIPLPEKTLRRTFDLRWPTFATFLSDLHAQVSDESKLSVEGSAQSLLTDKLDEILATVRMLKEAGSGQSSGQSETLPPIKVTRVGPDISERPRVFIASSTEGLRIAELIQVGLERVTETTIWTQSTFDLTRTPIESIVDSSIQFDFAIVVLTSDDMLQKRGDMKPAPRDNLLFELGLFTGSLGRARTFMVYCRDEDLHLPSDLMGVTAATYSRRSDGNLEAALGPVCTRIKQAMGVA